jgi:hypothetical protein
VSESSDTKSRSRRCHNVWHAPRSNWMRRESTGAHFTLKLANLGRTSVGDGWFKSPVAHNSAKAEGLANAARPNPRVINGKLSQPMSSAIAAIDGDSLSRRVELQTPTAPDRAQ